MIPNILPRWPLAFEEIRRDLGYSRSADDAVTRQLAARLAGPEYDAAAVLRHVKEQARHRTVHVVGAGDSALDAVKRLPREETLWVADGVATACREARRWPSLVVTDLDGPIQDQLEGARKGAFVLVHAHGDNGPSIDAYLSLFPAKKIAGSCQVRPVAPLINPGGFTDGDRAVHLALHYGAKEVILHGFEYAKAGRYSGSFDPATKPRKLEWARKLIARLIDAGAPVRYA